MQLSKIFRSHMVFQANKPIRVFGEGAGECEISFCGQTKKVVSDGDSWLIEFPSMEYGGPYEMNVNLNGDKIVIDDIYIGEVYLFAGQSNMQQKCNEANKPEKSYTPNGLVRFYVCDRLEDGDLYNTDNGWLVCDDVVSQNISAIGYYTACEVNLRKNVAVGGVCCYQGASVIETWLPKDSLKDAGIVVPADKKTWSHTCVEYSAWNGEGCLYDFAFSKICPFSFSTVVWYQGESDATPAEADVYAEELAVLIDIWRSDLKDSELPFVVIQLADLDSEGINKDGWARMQNAQMEVCKLRQGIQSVICRDICETFDIHPPTKDKLAIRIADALNL